VDGGIPAAFISLNTYSQRAQTDRGHPPFAPALFQFPGKQLDAAAADYLASGLRASAERHTVQGYRLRTCSAAF